MTAPTRTRWLAGLLVASTVAAGVAWSYSGTARAAAKTATRDGAACRAELSAIAAAGSAAGRGSGGDDLAVNRVLRAAAAEAGVAGQLTGVDAGHPGRVGDTDFVRTPVYVRLDAVTLRELVTLLLRLSSSGDGVRVSDVDLTPATTSPAAAGERWTADLTVGFLSYDPRPVRR